MSEAAKHTPTPWNTNSPDETLILGPDRQIVATTLQDEEDYQANYDARSADAELIVKAVNAHDDALATLREAYTALAFAFNRIQGSARSTDGELCQTFGKVRGRIENVFRKVGVPL